MLGNQSLLFCLYHFVFLNVLLVLLLIFIITVLHRDNGNEKVNVVGSY